MIYYLVSRPHAYTVESLLQSPWGEPFRPLIKFIPYDTLLQAKRLPSGSYIFTDFDRLTPTETEQVAQIWQSLAAKLPADALLNHPIRSHQRYQLLRTLYEARINQFNVYRLTEVRPPQQFPVFLRGENDHEGARTKLLHSQTELDEVIEALIRQGKTLTDKIITEFCPTADPQGVIRKYSALLVGERLLPRHVLFSTENWVLKVPDLTPPEFVAEEAEYLAQNPHAAQLHSIFELAKINFGRIDYGIVNGKVQVWEINTNPLLLWPVNHEPEQEARLANHAQFAEQLLAAFQAFNEFSQTETAPTP
jgi:hypothetical protein